MERKRDLPLSILASSETRRAAGLASAVMVGNVVALGFTVVFTHALGGARYGSLAALVSTFIILMVPGAAVQTTVAREVSRAVASGDPRAGAGIRRWLRQLTVATIVVVAISVLARNLLAGVIGVPHVPWGAAGTLPSGVLWLMVSVERGALQGFQRYRALGVSIVGEQVGRLLFSVLLVLAGLSTTGAFLGTDLTLIAVALVLGVSLQRSLPAAADDRGGERLGDMLLRARGPVLALALIAWLQDGHIIIVKHIASANAAGAWAAAAVAAKAIMWLATGLAMYVVPEAARRIQRGGDARGVLLRAMAFIAVIAIPMVLVYAVAGRPLLRAVFGLTAAAGALPLLGMGMSALACSYLATQYQLALHRVRFIALIAVAAIAQPLIMLSIGSKLTELATGLLVVQVALAAALVGVALRGSRPAAAPQAVEIEEFPPAFTEA